jgi:hypothetical protein
MLNRFLTVYQKTSNTDPEIIRGFKYSNFPGVYNPVPPLADDEHEMEPINVDPEKEDDVSAAQPEEEDEGDDIPGEQMRKEYDMEGGGWDVVGDDDVKQVGGCCNSQRMSPLRMKINKELLQPICSEVGVKLPWEEVDDVLQLNMPDEMQVTRPQALKVAGVIIPRFLQQLEIIVPPTVSRRLINILARCLTGMGREHYDELLGAGSGKIGPVRRYLRSDKWKTDSKVLVQGLKMLAVKGLDKLAAGATQLGVKGAIGSVLLNMASNKLASLK